MELAQRPILQIMYIKKLKLTLILIQFMTNLMQSQRLDLLKIQKH
ncbi:unnamed protein product [Paramecium octaurelia]|uniref:Uncharacterized protein n=1 Tax=Paramecium octaurelia TaxID=43137 RepID=A0A8S1SZF5_PAROT|nr:unnamed protein product [Paramecium octaurelia]